MHSQDFMIDVIVILVAAVVSAMVARQLKLPPIIGYLLAGAVIGPFSLGFVSDVGAIERVGGLGVVFLLFAVGLELPFDRLRVMRGGILSLGAAQFLVTGLILALAAWAFGAGPSGAFIIGVALAMSSTAIVLQILIERREMNTQIGRSTLAVLLSQDLAVGPMLAIALAIGGDEVMQLDWEVALAVVEPVLAVVLIIALGRLVLRPLFRPVAATRNFDIFSATTLLVILLIGWLTEKAGLSMAFGAFLAGLLLADTAYRHQVAAVMQPFRGLLLGLFFIAVGMSIDFATLADNVWLLAVLVLALLASKTLIILGLGLAFDYSISRSIYLGFLLAPSGEFAFALLGAGLTNNSIDPTAGHLLISSVIVSMMLAPLLATAGRWVFERFEPALGDGLREAALHDDEMTDHVIIAGFGRVGRAIANKLEAQGIEFVAIDSDPDRVHAGKNAGQNVYYGDAARPEVLEALRLDRARGVIVALGDPALALRLVSLLRYIFPNLKIFARAYDDEQRIALTNAGADQVVQETAGVASSLAGQVLAELRPADPEVKSPESEARQT